MSDQDVVPQAPSRDEQGVAFPVVGASRSTSATGKAVFADAARAADPELAGAIESERDWRRRYLPHIRRLVETGVASSDTAGDIASAGIGSLYRRFEFVRDGQTMPLRQALTSPPPARLTLDTVTVQGRGSGSDELSVPYRGQRLRGDDLHRQLDQWERDGIVEPSFSEAIRLVMANRDWLDLSDRQFVVLGAGAEMGPLFSLGRWGATVAPVDLPRPDLWRRVLKTIRAGRGRALVPLHAPVTDADDDAAVAEAAGANLILAPNYDELVASAEGVRFGIADSLVPQQGPNYALAKRLQQWRATLAREQGVLTSANVAPPTRTRSVLKNRALAAAYAGARRFGVEVFEPSTSNTLMAAMLVHDLRNDKGVAQPTTALRHPYELFSAGANHGGLWRNAFAPRSVLGLAVVFGLVQRRT
ncbi:MAG: hypothetical protein LC789_09885 [Actinobacteria bacterium]|nr:hypothetical protein [Actinomycetota bacterium]